MINKQLIFNNGTTILATTLAEVYLIESAGNYTKYYFGKTHGLKLLTLKTIEVDLPPNTFIKINRGQLVNKQMIASYKRCNRQVEICLNNGVTLTMSRNISAEFLNQK